ncbi:type II toxin-antitoxin system VapC family toxin [Amycolatopsis sp. GM8]|uniref:type II toxin-antitoxin system VapC family toxin n=1 Tax=Amycolatopsis sp. GM8 TaxID=2896530 RepID=UPI001F3390B2|nr:type II toxin-antitoxin system VapC family toxin [Amycolatopsis sp. GM8]
MILVADASFAAKVMLQEDGTDIALRWWADDAVTWVAPSIIAAEVEAALGVHQRSHPRVFTRSRRKLASTTWASMLDGIVLHMVDRSLADLAVRLIQDHGPLRGADACYVAVALKAAEEPGAEVVLGSFDRQQRRAASATGIPLTTLP